MNSNILICQLSKQKQEEIKRKIIEYLKGEGIEEIDEIVENVMCGRLVHLEEFINIQPFLEKAKVIEVKFDKKLK